MKLKSVMGKRRSSPPSGLVTFVFTDVEGSTRLLQELGSTSYADALLEHRHRVRQIIEAHTGFELGTEGDAFFIAFDDAFQALAAADAIQAACREGTIRVRIGIHTGNPLLLDGDYFGLDVHKAARICSAAHGGQVVASQATRDAAGRQLRDLGVHRLKDLTAPERLFQLGDGEFAPLRTLYRANLPVVATPLLGRDRELAELTALLQSNRLVTLTGPGGMGKTRLALAVAAQLAEDVVDGVWWVPLAAVTDPALVLAEIASVLDAREPVATHIAGQQLVIVLDNLEQIIDSAPDVADLLAGAPGLRIIATSRERLAIAAEQEYPLSPLSETAAAELFVTRARQVKSDFLPDDNVTEICRRLDCLPLALELASTRVKLMGASQILARLDRRLPLLSAGHRDLPARQATMRAVIDWSYDLLSAREQQVFRSLATFAGTFELDAAERVCRASLDELQSLVDKSLLRGTESGRFYLLDTTREYARDRLDECGETGEMTCRHAEWFLALGPAARTGLGGRDQRTWIDRLRADIDNYRAALEWSLDADIAHGVELCSALFHLWHMGGYYDELIRWCESARARDDLEVSTRARVLTTLGNTLFYAEELDRSEAALTESFALFGAVGDDGGAGESRAMLTKVVWAMGDIERATRLQEETLAAAESRRDEAEIAQALHLLGEYVRDTGDIERGQAYLQRAIALHVQRGDQLFAMKSMHSLADLELDSRAVAKAARRYADALTIAVDFDDERSAAYCIAGLACVAAAEGALPRAGLLWATAEAAESRLGFRMLKNERARYETIIASVVGDLGYQQGVRDAEGLAISDAARLAVESVR